MIELHPADVILVSRQYQGWKDAIPHNTVSYLISKRIQQLTGSEFNHTAMAIDGENIIEALDHVQNSPISKYLDPKKYRIKVLRYKYASQGTKEAIVEWALKQLNEKYDYWLLFKIRMILLLSGIDRLRISIENGSIDSSVWICSQLVQSAYRSQGIHFMDRLMYPCDFDGRDDYEVVFDNEEK